MQEQNRLNPAQRELEEALASVAPIAARVDPIAAAFDAGRKSNRRQLHFWRAAAGIVLALGVASRLVPRGHDSMLPAPDRSETTVVAREATGTPLPQQSFLMLQRAVDEKGLDALPAANVWRAESLLERETL
jgi:hypothetical protein